MSKRTKIIESDVQPNPKEAEIWAKTNEDGSRELKWYNHDTGGFEDCANENEGGDLKYEYYTLDSSVVKFTYYGTFLYVLDSAYILYKDTDSGLIFEVNLNQIIVQVIGSASNMELFDHIVAIKCTVHDKPLWSKNSYMKIPNGSLVDKMNYLVTTGMLGNIDIDAIIPITKDKYESMITATIEDVCNPIN